MRDAIIDAVFNEIVSVAREQTNDTPLTAALVALYEAMMDMNGCVAEWVDRRNDVTEALRERGIHE